MSNFNRGSEWRRWDLHVHTPYSYLNNQFGDDFDNYVKQLFTKAIENQIAVIGITDYFCIEGYKKIKNDYLLNPEKLKSLFDEEEIKKIENIQILPNIEFRLNKIIGTNRVNFHVIFSENVTENDIEENFLHDLEFIYEGNPQGTDEKWKLKLLNIEELGKKLISQQPELGDNNMFVGMKCAVVDESQILNILNNKQSKFKDKYLIITPPDEDLSGINWKSQDHLVRKVIIQKTDLLFASNPKTIKWGLGEFNSSKKEFIDEFKSIKATIWGSDAHDFDNLFKPSQKRYTWIKSDTTFNGLKQILFEPSRVYIGENKPQEPIYKLESINLKFDENIKWDKDEFCFAKEREPILFSPYFNCIIGGRGSGKSTFVNLIAHQTGHQDKVKSFFKDLKIDNNIALNPAYLDNIEFIAQSDIDRFAKDTNEFTNAIFIRLNKLSNGALIAKESEITSFLINIDNQINSLQKKVKLQETLLNLRNNFKKNNNLIKTFQDLEYKVAKKNLEDTTKELGLLEYSRLKYKELYESLEKIALNPKIELESTNSYDNFYNDLLVKIQNLYIKTKNLDYTEAKAKIEDLYNNKEQFSKQIKEYLISKDIKDDSLNDISNAHENIEKIKNEIKVTINNLRKIKQEIEEFNFIEFDKKSLEFSTLIDNEIEKINSEFREIQAKNPEDVKLIKVNFNTNGNIVHETITKLIKILEIDKVVSGVRSSFYDYIIRGTDLSIIDNQEYDNFFVNFRNNPKILTTTATYKVIEDILNNQLNFNIYKLLLKKSQYDIKNNKILEVLYDNKTLAKSSYGQRCTTALIVLISLGNNPIIIDEPEAHLDSSLIANYLVELIKRMKKHRQIIFATHNANFVLNGDAELVIKLKNTDNFSTFDSFTIEDIAYRHDLLQLEGGIEAFQKREKKYGNMD
ncbi:MAG: hypothetical protein WC279_01945 [Sulfurimonas sp.]|jgi:energy-coupling factor transporter ATP-binding protein EcfA2|uniref:TrlF family AAA-like ATPase n=1 Tax=Sulfurimonas sp. TaxID=2022749 RepID=UPI003568D42D